MVKCGWRPSISIRQGVAVLALVGGLTGGGWAVPVSVSAAAFPICFKASATPYDHQAQLAIENAKLTKVTSRGRVIARLTPACARIQGGDISISWELQPTRAWARLAGPDRQGAAQQVLAAVEGQLGSLYVGYRDNLSNTRLPGGPLTEEWFGQLYTPLTSGSNAWIEVGEYDWTEVSRNYWTYDLIGWYAPSGSADWTEQCSSTSVVLPACPNGDSGLTVKLEGMMDYGQYAG